MKAKGDILESMLSIGVFQKEVVLFFRSIFFGLANEAAGPPTNF